MKCGRRDWDSAAADEISDDRLVIPNELRGKEEIKDNFRYYRHHITILVYRLLPIIITRREKKTCLLVLRTLLKFGHLDLDDSQTQPLNTQKHTEKHAGHKTTFTDPSPTGSEWFSVVIT